ncbi:hypothetical protein GDO86_010627, partial [Hymenochirus boettgeri]
MPSPLVISIVVLTWILIVVGILLNFFIVAVTVIWWFQSKRLEIINIILASIGMSRLALILFFVVIFPWVPISDALFAVLSMYVTFCCLWFDTILCVFYCVKICNYNHPFFMYLKLRIFKMVPWMFLMSITASMICSLPFGWLVFTTIINNTTNSTNSTNSTQDGSTPLQINMFNIFILYLSGCFVPFFIFCIAICLLIRSLWKHIGHMTGSNVGLGNPRLHAHIRAVRTMVSFLVIYIIFFISSTFKFVPSMINNTTVQLLLNVIICWYPTMHSVVLVVMNRKMKLLLYHFLCC